MVKVTEIESYKEYGKCVSSSNGVIEAYVTVDVGPRIIQFGYKDGQNFMNDNRTDLGAKPYDQVNMDLFGEN